VAAVTYCNVLVLAAEEFNRFLKTYPKVREEIEKTALRREEDNAGHRLDAADRRQEQSDPDMARTERQLAPASE
jgi:CRP-like cAMP-binding protein